MIAADAMIWEPIVAAPRVVTSRVDRSIEPEPIEERPQHLTERAPNLETRGIRRAHP